MLKSLKSLKSLEYAWDQLFIFMLVLSVAVFAISFAIEINPAIEKTLEKIDIAILMGYYGFFANGLMRAKSKPAYCKQHIFLIALLLIPFLPIARILYRYRRLADIGTDSLWHFLDQVDML